MKEEVVIGLEVHIQLMTNAKMFCHCSTDYIGKEPNTNTCPVCLGLPGSLPVLNKKVLEFAVRTSVALNCKINQVSRFHRKNYFYPDLPKAYQISQYDLPLSINGYMEISIPESGEKRKIGITRVHIEEDAGKLVHEGDITSSSYSLADYNRCGIPLAEIVTEPDFRSPEEAQIFLVKLRSIVQHLGVCDGNMEEGSMRCDANVSLRDAKTGALGTKAEIKNMNSFKAVKKALQFEVDRQRRLLDEGEKIVQETRHWDESKNITISMRSKEEAHDYRYFPEPDLLPIKVDVKTIDKIRKSLPELPEARRERFIKNYQIPKYDAEILTSSKALGDYYEKAAFLYSNTKVLSNWIMGELIRYLNEEKIEIKDSPISSEKLVEMLKLIDEGVISGKMAKDVFEKMFKTGKDASQIVKESGITQITDKGELFEVIDKVINENPKSIEDFNQGKEKALNYLVGQVMRYTKGRAKPDFVFDTLKQRLKR
ncbi:MAG: Asp-tRNA(Asn)/Glu-tRNA(Gln) amidotransferase subunit GatB [Atribacteria sp.]|nr:Asp-tRNA(Asn)/Glu-tRNA(Gln) amidotransferase subunit GatB [Candidatus Atribacteria bacterium]MBU4047030.1 Asp-tRNA(Asn)/Glu-tRNA(Gln) amidotransferase subunit GatB [bacterium]